MATNFPDTSINNPNTGVGWANGDAFDDTAESGLVYYWYDPVWKTEFTPTAASDARYVEVDGDTMTGDLTVPSLNGGPLAGFRNQIINGDFRIWQRGDSGSISPTDALQNFYNDTYTADRFQIRFKRPVGVASFDWEKEEITDPNVPHNYGVKLTVVATGDDGYHSFAQKIEDAKSLQSGEYTLSFWAASTTATRNISVRTGVFYAAADGRNERFSTTTIELTSTYTKYEIPFTVTSQRDKANTDTSGVDVTFVLEGAEVPHQSGEFIFTGVQLEPGPVATPFEHRPIGTELALCQRYYQIIEYSRYTPFWIRGSNSNGGSSFRWRRPVEMRAVPTGDFIDTPGLVTWDNIGSGQKGCTSAGGDGLSVYMGGGKRWFNIGVNDVNGLANNELRAFAVYDAAPDGNNTFFFTYDAEL